MQSDYARYEFHVVVQRLQTFCSEDLGGFYLDVLKDRLYTTGKASRARRSAQTVLALIRDALLELMAPVLSFTAEEAWRIVHPADPSIFCRTWIDALPKLPDAAALLAKWSRILAVRAAVQKELETLRQAGKVGSSLQAEVTIAAAGDDYDALASLGDDLRFVLITSAARSSRGERSRSARRRARTRSASVAGTIAPMSAPTPRIRRCADDACRTCSGRASRAHSRERIARRLPNAHRTRHRKAERERPAAMGALAVAHRRRDRRRSGDEGGDPGVDRARATVGPSRRSSASC